MRSFWVMPLSFVALGCAGGTGSSEGHAAPLLSANGLVIRQVYGGGGNTSATLKADFVEIFNAGAQVRSVAGLSIQYASSKGSYGGADNFITELPDMSLAPGQSLLVQGALGSAGSVDLPTPDVTDATPISLGASAGRIALVMGVESLSCGAVDAVCSSVALARILDAAAYGPGTTLGEGSPTAQTSNTQAILRKQSGCLDTDDNAADFDVALATPRNAASPRQPCGVVQPDAGPAPDAGPVPDAGPADAGTPPGAPGAVRIHDIQGKTHVSELNGSLVTRVEGIVTALSARGFWFEDPAPDSDPATSEGLFVYTNTAPSVSVGARVHVSGTVTEFRPACSACTESSSAFANLTTTEITAPTEIITVAVDQPLPPATVIGPAGRMPPLSHIADAPSGGDVEAGSLLDVVNEGLDFHESLEGMRISLPKAVASGPTIDFTSTQEVAVSLLDARSRVTPRGGLLIAEPGVGEDAQPERFHVSSLLSGYDGFPKLDVGDRFADALTGVVDYSFGKFLVLPTQLPAVLRSGLEREQVTLPTAGSAARTLDVATFNVENLGGSAEQKRFDDLANAVVERLDSPDLLVLEEVQDDSGATDDGNTSATSTITRLTAAIAAAGGPVYEYRDIAPLANQDGGEPGGNIRIGMLFRPDRGLAFIDRAGGGAMVAATVVDRAGVPQLSTSPGRIAPADEAWTASRKPLVAEFTFEGERLFVIGNHFNSKGGDQPPFGRFQPPVRSSEVQREKQSKLVSSFVKEILAIDAFANVVVLGDLNDYRYSTAVGRLVSETGLFHLVDRLPELERYGYVYQGVSQLLDHILVSSALNEKLLGFDVVHLNAEFSEQLSDHDPSVARFAFGQRPITPDGDAGPSDGGDNGGDSSAGSSNGATEDGNGVGGSTGLDSDSDPISGVPRDDKPKSGCSAAPAANTQGFGWLAMFGLAWLTARRRCR